MLKPNSNFKLSKSAKRIIAAITDKNYSDILKKNFIQAELCSVLQYHSPKVKKEDREE
jgi:hypothetical protein